MKLIYLTLLTFSICSASSSTQLGICISLCEDVDGQLLCQQPAQQGEPICEVPGYREEGIAESACHRKGEQPCTGYRWDPESGFSAEVEGRLSVFWESL